MAAKVRLEHSTSALQDAYEHEYQAGMADFKKQMNRMVFGTGSYHKSSPACDYSYDSKQHIHIATIKPETKDIKKMSKKELHETVMLMQQNIQSLRATNNRLSDDLDAAKRNFNDELERIERESSDPKVEKKILAKLRDGKEVCDKSNKDVQFKRAVMSLRHKGLVTTSRWNNCVALTDTAKDYEELL